jgi:hypothetical protein
LREIDTKTGGHSFLDITDKLDKVREIGLGSLDLP